MQAWAPPRPDSPRIADIEVLRAVAISMVFVQHIPLNLFAWHSFLDDFLPAYWQGTAGVDLFFAISGFVITRSLLPTLKDCVEAPAFLAASLRFWVRRFWRLQPSAIIWLAVPIVLSMTYNRSGAFAGVHANLADALAAIVGIYNFRFAATYGHGGGGIIFPYWSLSLEEQFYLMLPVMVFVFRSRIVLVMLALLAFQFVIPFEEIFKVTRTGAVSIGVLLAIWSRHRTYHLAEPLFLGRSPAIRAAFLACIVALIGALQSDLPRPLATIPYGIAAVLCGVLVHAASYGRGYIMQPGLTRSVCVWLGTRSYGIYLVHLPAFALTSELYFRFRPPAFDHGLRLEAHYLCVAAVLTLTFAELNFRFVETPGRRYGRMLNVFRQNSDDSISRVRQS